MIKSYVSFCFDYWKLRLEIEALRPGMIFSKGWFKSVSFIHQHQIFRIRVSIYLNINTPPIIGLTFFSSGRDSSELEKIKY